MPARCSQGTSNGPNQVSDQRWTSGSRQRTPSRCPSTTPSRRGDGAEHQAAAEDHPAALARACRRSPPSGRGCATAGARSRRTPVRPAAPPRAAPSPRSSTITATMASSAAELQERISAGISERGGGSVTTARDSTVAPIALSSSDLLPGDRTAGDQPGGPVAPAGRCRGCPTGPATIGYVREDGRLGDPDDRRSGRPSATRSRASPTAYPSVEHRLVDDDLVGRGGPATRPSGRRDPSVERVAQVDLGRPRRTRRRRRCRTRHPSGAPRAAARRRALRERRPSGRRRCRGSPVGGVGLVGVEGLDHRRRRQRVRRPARSAAPRRRSSPSTLFTCGSGSRRRPQSPRAPATRSSPAPGSSDHGPATASRRARRSGSRQPASQLTGWSPTRGGGRPGRTRSRRSPRRRAGTPPGRPRRRAVPRG